MSFMEKFVWKQAPLSSVLAPVVAGVCYVIAVLLYTRYYMPRRTFETKNMQVQDVFPQHHYVLHAKISTHSPMNELTRPS